MINVASGTYEGFTITDFPTILCFNFTGNPKFTSEILLRNTKVAFEGDFTIDVSSKTYSANSWRSILDLAYMSQIVLNGNITIIGDKTSYSTSYSIGIGVWSGSNITTSTGSGATISYTYFGVRSEHSSHALFRFLNTSNVKTKSESWTGGTITIQA